MCLIIWNLRTGIPSADYQALTPLPPPSLRSVGHSSFIIAPSDLPLSVGRYHRGITQREPTHWASPLDTCGVVVLLCQLASVSGEDALEAGEEIPVEVLNDRAGTLITLAVYADGCLLSVVLRYYLEAVSTHTVGVAEDTFKKLPLKFLDDVVDCPLHIGVELEALCAVHHLDGKGVGGGVLAYYL